MIFRDIYRVMRCNILHVKVGKIKYEYGIFAKEIEGRPYITDLFLCEVLEVKAVGAVSYTHLTLQTTYVE